MHVDGQVQYTYIKHNIFYISHSLINHDMTSSHIGMLKFVLLTLNVVRMEWHATLFHRLYILTKYHIKAFGLLDYAVVKHVCGCESGISIST